MVDYTKGTPLTLSISRGRAGRDACSDGNSGSLLPWGEGQDARGCDQAWRRNIALGGRSNDGHKSRPPRRPLRMLPQQKSARRPLTAPWFKLSPINQRRLRAFKANKRGYYSFVLFVVLFLLTLFAEFIANDKPFLVKYDGAFYVPIFKMYTEKQFGGEFETEADYRDPAVQQFIHEKGGWIVWPPIPYSYRTIKLDLPVPAPAPPSWDNWLGTDDQGRDVVARVIYGFRISVLFGLILTVLLGGRGRDGRRGAGLFRRLDRSSAAALHRNPGLAAAPLYSLDPVRDFGAKLLDAAWDHAPVRMDRVRRAGARRVPARPELRICPRGAGAWPVQPADYVQAPAAQRDGGDRNLPALHPRRRNRRADRARLPRLRPAARLAIAWASCCSRASRTCKRRGSG